METTLSNIVNSSLNMYGFHLVSTYKYEIGKFFLDNHLSSLQLMQNNMAYLNQCLLLNT